jgi:glutathione reductase (NADPH)
VNYGCVPKKLFFYAAQFRSEIQDARGYGWQIPEPRFDWRALKHAKNEEIARLNGIYARLLANAGVEMVKGTARLEDAHTVVVDGQRKLRAENILLGACCARAHLPA